MDITDLEDKAAVEDKMPDALKVIIADCVKDLSAYDLAETMNSLEWEDETVRGSFVDQNFLGDYIYDAFDLHDIDVWEVLSGILIERQKAEAEANKE